MYRCGCFRSRCTILIRPWHSPILPKSHKQAKKKHNETLPSFSSLMCLRLAGLMPARQGDPMEISGSHDWYIVPYIEYINLLKYQRDGIVKWHSEEEKTSKEPLTCSNCMGDRYWDSCYDWILVAWDIQVVPRSISLACNLPGRQ